MAFDGSIRPRCSFNYVVLDERCGLLAEYVWPTLQVIAWTLGMLARHYFPSLSFFFSLSLPISSSSHSLLSLPLPVLSLVSAIGWECTGVVSTFSRDGPSWLHLCIDWLSNGESGLKEKLCWESSVHRHSWKGEAILSVNNICFTKYRNKILLIIHVFTQCLE